MVNCKVSRVDLAPTDTTDTFVLSEELRALDVLDK